MPGSSHAAATHTGRRPTQDVATRIEMGGWVFSEVGTRGYEAQAPLDRATNKVMPGRTNGRYIPVV